MSNRHWFILALLLALAALSMRAQTSLYSPATQAEVNAGTVSGKFVSPRTLGSWSGAGVLPSGAPGAQLVYNSAGTAIATNSRFFFPGYFFTGPTRVMTAGDSIAAAGGGVAQTNSPLGLIFHNGYLPANFVYATNAGVGGQTAATTLAHYTTDTSAWKTSGGTNLLNIFNASVNDFAAGATAASVWLTTSNYCVSNHLDGNYIMVCEVNPYANMEPAAGHELARYNQLLRTHAGTWDYILCVSYILPPPPNSVYYADHIHPSAVGNDDLAWNMALLLQSGRYNGYPSSPVYQNPNTFSGSVRGPVDRAQSATIFLRDGGIRYLVDGDLGASCGLAPTANGDIILYNTAVGGSFTGWGGTTSFLIQTGDSSVTVASNWVFRTAGRAILTNGFELPYRATQNTTSFQGAAFGSEGTNVVVVLQNAAGVKTTNKVTLTSYP